MRTALVTGASRGIGRGIALKLAEQGYGFTIAARSADALADVGDELSKAGAADVLVHPADMADPDALRALVAAHQTRFDTLNTLILNAGVGTAGAVADFNLGRFTKIFAVNVAAALTLTQQALPLLRRAAVNDERGSRIVAVSSITGAYPEAGLAVYGASKAALLSLIETINLEESPNGVMATAIAPAYVETDMSAWVADRIPAHTMIPVADVVATVDLILGLHRNTSITRLLMARSGTTGQHA